MDAGGWGEERGEEKYIKTKGEIEEKMNHAANEKSFWAFFRESFLKAFLNFKAWN